MGGGGRGESNPFLKGKRGFPKFSYKTQIIRCIATVYQGFLSTIIVTDRMIESRNKLLGLSCFYNRWKS